MWREVKWTVGLSILAYFGGWRLVLLGAQSCFIVTNYILRCFWLILAGAPVKTESNPSLKAAIQNVTSDFDQLTTIIQEFLTSGHGDEQAFRAYLADKATRSNPKLEALLDWILFSYKFIVPFVIFYFMSQSRSQQRSVGAPAAGEAKTDLTPAKKSLAPSTYSASDFDELEELGTPEDFANQHRKLEPTKKAAHGVNNVCC